MAGKKFAAEFALRRNVSAQDKILIQDSDDDVVKYAYPPQIASLSGYAYAQSVADLPLLPTNKSIGYIVGQMLYIYVGMGGDTKDELYQSVGFFVGPQGVQGEKGEKGERGEQGVQGPKGDNGGLSLQELDIYLATKQYVTGDTLADMLAGYVSNTSLMRDYVTIAKTQDVTGVKNFTAGVQFGGLPMYKSKDDTVYLDANLVVRGAVTMYGMNTTTSPSIFSTLPIDGKTIGRNERGELYVIGGTSGDGGGTGGGISIADVENYLTTNSYATQSWVTGKGYITGITGTMVTNALGYTPLDKQGVAFDSNKFGGLSVADFARVKQDVSDFDANNMPDGVWGGKLFGSPNWALDYYAYLSVGSGNYKMQFNGVGNRLTYRAGNESGIGNKGWVEILSSANYSNYALPITGGAISGNLAIGGTTALDKLHVYGRGRFVMQRQGDQSSIVPDATALTISTNLASYSGYNTGIGFNALGDYGSLTYKNHIHAWIGLGGATTTAEAECYPLVFATNGSTTTGTAPIERMRINPDGQVIVTGALRLGQNNRTCIMENPFAAYGMTLADGNNNPLVTVSYFDDHAYVYNYKNSKENSGIAFYDDGRVVVAQNLISTGAITMYYSSDKRLKQNIRRVDASKTLMSLGGVYQYEYIDGEVARNSTYGGSHYGLIYQNVKGTALDKMCHEREDGMGALNYLDTNFISLIAGATMENISEVEKLKKENKALRKRVEQLEKRIA